MAINKKLIHFKTFANFNSLKLSANEANTKYTTGISGTETSGNPDILYQSICFIKDTQQIWTHGLIYNASAENKGEPYIIDISLYEDGQTGPEIEELYNNLVDTWSNNRPIYCKTPSDAISPTMWVHIEALNVTMLYVPCVFTGDILSSTVIAVSILDGEYIFNMAELEKDLSALVDLNYLATINGQSLINGGQDIVILCEGNEISINSTDMNEVHRIVLDAYVNNKPLTAVGSLGEKVVITRFYADEYSYLIQYVDAGELFVTPGMNKIVTATCVLEDGEYTTDITGVLIPNELNDLEGTADLVYKTNLATINGQSLLNGGQNITIEGGTSGVFVKFNELFAVGTLTTNESDVFNVVKTAMESNTPLLLCDNNYSIILVSYYPLKVGNTIIASGILSLNVYNFTFTSGSNQITVTELKIASLSNIPTTTSQLTNDSGFITSADNVASATKLQTMRYINGAPFDGTNNVVSYAVCTTGASTTAKTVNISNFSLVTGAQVRVEFDFPNTASAPTLNVGGTGAKRMSYKGSLITNSNFTFYITKVYTFTYDGTYWALEGNWDEAPKTFRDLSNNNFLTCEFMGEAGDVIWSDDDANRVAHIQEWMEELSMGKVCVLDFDDEYYSSVIAFNFRTDANFGMGMCHFSYIFEGYLYEVEYDEVALPVTLTIINKTLIGGGGSSNANVQAVDTGDVLDDVNVDYATKTYVDDKVANINLTNYATIEYVDGLVGDINSILESIISGRSGVSLITFTIGDTEYQAEEGMTWEEWVNSEYNTLNYNIGGELVISYSGSSYVDTVTPSDIILNNGVYVLANLS